MKKFGRQQWKEGPIVAALPAISAGMSILGGLKGLMAKEPKAPKEAEVKPPTVMPTEDSALVAEAKRKSLLAQVQRGGRASTVLTDNETFGGN